jgi:UPF0042 nucleotide-binding protein
MALASINFVIVSGLSGSGKSIALQALEDMGYYCIDNLPANLLPQFATELQRGDDGAIPNCAVSIDVRNRNFLGGLSKNLDALRKLNINYNIVFLDADLPTLLARYSETRRKHPLTNDETSLVEAIKSERLLLEPLSTEATRHIDTTQTTPHELRDTIRAFAGASSQHELTVLFESFGFKHGNPLDADFVFDVRCLPNPHWHPELRPLTGLEAPVENFLADKQSVREMISQISKFISNWLPQFQAENRSYITIAIGCTGGQHRSVYIATKLAEHMVNNSKLNVQTRHRELENP